MEPSLVLNLEEVKLVVAALSIILIAVLGTIYWFYGQDTREEEVASVENMSFPLPDKPSIAVLPFDNMSDHSEQEYFVDGMTEDLITDLSNISGVSTSKRIVLAGPSPSF